MMMLAMVAQSRPKRDKGLSGLDMKFPAWLGNLEGRSLKPRKLLQPPPELISPVAKPSSARRAHCPKRKGWVSCCRVWSNADPMTSTADLAKAGLLRVEHAAAACKVLRREGGVNRNSGTSKFWHRSPRLRFNLLVPQGFHRIELRRAQRRYHPAGYTNE